MGQVATTIQHSNSPPQTPLSLFAPSGLRITSTPQPTFYVPSNPALLEKD
ncbi:MAG: hypothetical protein HYW48_10800 [Deltaproteobacteria bacterium]|nr:hypothetical protein [Deltaproteobacteria bacterium]